MNISLLIKTFFLLLITFSPSVVFAENSSTENKNKISTPPKNLILKPNATEGYAQEMGQNSSREEKINVIYREEKIPSKATGLTR